MEMKNKLKEILGKMTHRQVAAWGLFFLNDNFDALKSKYGWNPFARMYIFLVEKRVRRVLCRVASANDQPSSDTLRQIKGARGFAEYGRPLKSGFRFICSFLSQLEGGYESATSAGPDPEFEGGLYGYLSEVASEQASFLGEEPEPYLGRLLDRAKDVLRGPP